MSTYLSNIFSLTDFDSRDIQIDGVRLNTEVNRIFNSTKAKRGRTYDEIYASTKIGHTLENYLIKNGFVDDPRMYMDLKTPIGETVDAKVIQDISDSKISRVIRDMEERNAAGYSDKIKYVIIYGKTGTTYKYSSTVQL